MKINGVSGPIGSYQQSGARRAAKEQEVTRPAKSDGVELSREAQEVRALKEKISQAPDSRAEQIAELKRQVEAGTYRVDGRDVATKMLRARVFDQLA